MLTIHFARSPWSLTSTKYGFVTCRNSLAIELDHIFCLPMSCNNALSKFLPIIHPTHFPVSYYHPFSCQKLVPVSSGVWFFQHWHQCPLVFYSGNSSLKYFSLQVIFQLVSFGTLCFFLWVKRFWCLFQKEAKRWCDNTKLIAQSLMRIRLIFGLTQHRFTPIDGFLDKFAFTFNFLPCLCL